MTLEEYDIEIKPTKIFRGKGLCELAIEIMDNKDKCQDEEEEEYIKVHEMEYHIIELNKYEWESEAQLYGREILQISTSTDTWYYGLKYYLSQGECLENMDSKRRALQHISMQYHLINDILFQNNPEVVLLRCLEKDDVERVVIDLPDGPMGEHYVGKNSAHNFF